MDVRIGLQRKLSTEELMLLNCGVGEDSWVFLDCKEIQQVHPSQRKSVLNIHWKDWCWSWNSSTLATWREELTHWKRPWFWERLKAGGEGETRGWDGWMASSTWWTWVLVSSGSWWWTEKPGVLRSMGSQRVRHDWATELNWYMQKSAPNVCIRSVTQSCPTLCDPMDCSTLGFPVHHQLPEFTQTHVHQVDDAIQPSDPLSSPSPPALNLFQQQHPFSRLLSQCLRKKYIHPTTQEFTC